jgi:ADP-heptose:LPS heptosyltransferase
MKRFLLVRTDRVGDVLMITPVIRALRKNYPGCFIASLTQPHTSRLLENNPHLNLILTDDLKKESFRNVAKEIRRNKFTHGMLFLPTERAAYQMFLGGIKIRIGVGRKLYEIITGMKSVSRNNYIPLRHEADYCMDLVRKIGIQSDDLQPEIFLSGDEVDNAKSFLHSNGISQDAKIIVIHTGSGNSAPNWSEDKYFQLMQEIALFPDIAIILTAREMSRDLLMKISSSSFNNIVFNFSKELDDLRKIASLIAVSDLVFTSSTGPAHIAGALNIPSVTIHCRRPMSRVKRWGVISPTAVNLEVDESFCSKNCSSDKEICSIEEGISLAHVMDEIKAILSLK